MSTPQDPSSSNTSSGTSSGTSNSDHDAEHDADQAADEVILHSGVPGLDDVLGGGFGANRLYLLEGTPGAGKTTIALQFLLEGVRNHERVLYVTLSETQRELMGVARSHGLDLSGVTVRELLPTGNELELDQRHTMFHPSEVELGSTTLKMLEDVDAIKPTRVVFDSLSELRLMAGDSLRYRRQILALKQFFAGRRCTILLLDDMTAREQDVHVQSIAHAVIRLEQHNADYGATRRRMIVQKYRGQQFRSGYHDYKVVRGGVVVYPRLVAAESRGGLTQSVVLSGIEGFDTLLGGGIERGTSTLLVGAPGTGKSTMALQFAISAAQRGDCAALFIFDESEATLRTRCQGLGMDIESHLDSGHIKIRQIDPAEMSPGELVNAIREVVTEHNATVVVLDSLNGYLHAMPDERFLITQLHELLTYLGQAGVATLLIGAQHGLIGSAMQTPVDASYLADAVVMFRYFEAEGEVRQAISVVKKRSGVHERTIRRYWMDTSGIHIGEPLREYHGILTGVPTPIHEGKSA